MAAGKTEHLFPFRLLLGHFNWNPSTKRTLFLIINSLSFNVSCVTDSAHFGAYYMLLVSQSVPVNQFWSELLPQCCSSCPWFFSCTCIVWEERKKESKSKCKLREKNNNKGELIFHAFFSFLPSPLIYHHIPAFYYFSELHSMVAISAEVLRQKWSAV